MAGFRNSSLKQYYALMLGIIIFLIFMYENRIEIHRYDRKLGIINDTMSNQRMSVEDENSLKQKLAKPNKVPEEKIKLWYFQGGKLYPNQSEVSKKTGKRLANVLPQEDATNNRILNQLLFVPPNSGKHKTILLWVDGWFTIRPHSSFARVDFRRCPVNTCTLTIDPKLASQADLIVFPSSHNPPTFSKQPNQLYMIRLGESPLRTSNITNPGVYNWTSTYKYDSTIPMPYGKWVYYNSEVRQLEQNRNYAQNKTKKVAWVVSNCHAKNGRMEYARELQKYIEVDIYGRCGDVKCPHNSSMECFKMIENDYKFYLAFENSNCKEYITEKFYWNGLSRDILPIVMGARPEDYEQIAPHNSYIHVEDHRSPKDLADYLKLLDGDDELYNSFFKWKGTGEVLGGFVHFWCRTCAMLHDDYAISQRLWEPDINKSFIQPHDCTNGFWYDIEKTPQN